MREQYFCIFIFQQLLIVTVTNNTANCFVEGCLMLRLTETVDEDKIGVSVNSRFTMKVKQFQYGYVLDRLIS